MSSIYAPPADVDRHAFFIAFGAYIVFTLAIAYNQFTKSGGFYGGKTQGDKSSAAMHTEHFLGSKQISVVPLFLTLFSTIYSGYTLVGVVGMAAGPAGFISTIWLTSAPIVSLSSILLLPRLYALSRRRNYTGPTDLIMDRFDDRILQTLISLMLAAQGCLYLVAQFYTVKVLIPVLSGDRMNANVTAWFLAAVMWICEAIGGWNAITKTDAIQSAIMIISLVAVPCIAQNYYGGAAQSVDFNCEGLVTVNCSTPEFAGTLCAGNLGRDATRIGCAAEIGYTPMGVGYTAGYKTLNPAGTTWSRYFEPLTDFFIKGANQTVPGTPRTSYGTDSSGVFNNVALYMLGFNLLFFAFSLNPHWLQRTIAGATATGVKQANMAMNFASLIATLPGLLCGIMVGAHILPIRASAEPYGVLLAEFMNKEGFVEFVAVLAAVSVFAAIMSTVDSAMHGITNTISSDFVKNWFFVKYPAYDTPSMTLNISRVISFCFLFLSCAVALYEDKLNEEGSDVYAKLISWQNALLFQCVPSFYLALYQSKVKAGNHIIGIVAGLVTVIVMTWYEELHYNFGSRYAIEKDAKPAGVVPVFGILDNPDNYTDGAKTFYFAYAPGLWGGLMNLVITVVLNMVAGGDEKPWMPINTKVFGGSQLLGKDVTATMAHTTEPIKTTVGMLSMVATFLLCNLCLPWWGDANDDCDIKTISGTGAYGVGGWNGGQPYAAPFNNASNPFGAAGGSQSGDCTGPDMVNGLPHWVTVILGCYIVAMFTNFAAWSTWKPDPIDDVTVAPEGATAATAATTAAQDKAGEAGDILVTSV